ncbi:MAG: DNA-3-methyladenine glycosylase [Bacteroidetes bacterium]|nr:DNA-3-methyladenine glycosylase [Bacteroidota bacterium]
MGWRLQPAKGNKQQPGFAPSIVGINNFIAQTKKYLPVQKIKKLGYSFYSGTDVVKIARSLLGKILITQFNGIVTSGRIVETEAYEGVTDRASHAYNGRRTSRTEIMFDRGGKAYVYLCYGIHHLFNIVTNKKEVPHAVLVRAVEPLEGIDAMLKRTGKKKPGFTLTRGPGNVSKALGIATSHCGCDLQSKEICVIDDGFRISKNNIVASPRIGVDYAGEDAELMYRFFVKGNKYVSGKTA